MTSVSPGASIAKNELRRSRFLTLTLSSLHKGSKSARFVPLKTKVLEECSSGNGFHGRASASREALKTWPTGHVVFGGRSITAWGQHDLSGVLRSEGVPV